MLKGEWDQAFLSILVSLKFNKVPINAFISQGSLEQQYLEYESLCKVRKGIGNLLERLKGYGPANQIMTAYV